MKYTRQDHKVATQRDAEWQRKEKSPVGDYMTHLNNARRERIFSTPLAKRLYGDKL
jgi:hypothetical protein